MTSSELIALRSKYLNFKSNILEIIEENSKALDKIRDADVYLQEYYSINENSADNLYIKKAIGTMRDTLSSFNMTLNAIENEIAKINRQIEIAREKELAERIALAGK